MSLHPMAKKFLSEVEQANSAQPPLSEIDLNVLRQSITPTIISDKYDSINVENHIIEGPYGGIPIQIYRPSDEANQPAIMFYHGGGFILGDIKGYAPFCEKMAYYTQCTVISVDYRLAPEYKFPTAIVESYEATKWVYQHAKELKIDATRFAVMGDSAGGNIAAVMTHAARDKQEVDIALQVLIFPMTSFAIQTHSKQQYREGFFLTQEGLDLFETHYLRDKSDLTNPMASPLLADLHDLPPAFILTAEYDPLRDEAQEYAKKLIDSGVHVQIKTYQGMIHGFTTFTDLFGDESIEDIRDFVHVKFTLDR